MADRCPRCGYLFAREDGFFLGAFVINFGVTTVGLAVIMGVLIAVLAGGGAQRAIVAVAVAAALEVVVLPILFYPFSKTVWTAIDLAMHRGETWAADTSEMSGPASAATRRR
jgi:mannose/fructose/N-acetylgalactosamine-specific phosphotransferase system component IIC